MKKLLIILGALLMLASCSPQTDSGAAIVTSSFPVYDLARTIAGTDEGIDLLLPPGAEVHSYEVTPTDMKKIANSQLFIYVGGDSDHWIDNMIESKEMDINKHLKLMDHVNLLDEESSASMVEEDDHDHDHEEYDEHIWLSFENANLMVDAILKEMVEIYPEKKEDFSVNAEKLQAEIADLERDYQDMVETSSRQVIIVGDRFPFLYLVRSLGLDYDAAFPGCSADVEENAQAIRGLIDRVRAEDIPVVFTIEMSRGTIADRIVEETGAKKLMLHSVQNISKEEMEAGETYLSLMEKNLEVLKEALN